MMNSYDGSKTPTAICVTLFTACLCAACFVGLVGCGSGNKLGRLPISGKISLDDNPLPNGSITFAPKDPQGFSAGSVIASDGTYTILETKGLPPGEYTVQIFSSYQEGNEAGAPIHAGPELDKIVTIERIPKEYNSETTQVVTVTKENDNIFDFDISSKGK